MRDESFIYIKDIFELYAVLPTSNAEVERGFSTMNRVKNKLQNKMCAYSLRSVMMTRCNGCPWEDYEALRDFKLWRGKKRYLFKD